MTQTILFLCHGYPLESMGGVGIHVAMLIDEFVQKDWTIHLLVPKTSYRNRLEHKTERWGITTILHHRDISWEKSWNNKGNISILKEWLKTISPDVCHIHHLSGFPLDLPTLLPNSTISVMTLHDYAIPCARGQLYHREHDICTGPNLTKCTLCLEQYLPKNNGQKIMELRIQKAEQCLSKIDSLLSPSKDLIQRMKAIYPLLHIRLTALPIKVDRSPRIHPRQYDFIFVGTLIPTKGLHIAIKAFLQFPEGESSLTIVGNSGVFPTWQGYETMCQKLASLHPNIRWVGELTHNQTLDEISKHNCLVLPSQWPENSPISIREATALGLHVICSAHGGSSELSGSVHKLESNDPYELHRLYRRMQKLPAANIQCWPTPTEYCIEMTSLYEWRRKQKQNKCIN
jgi:glycosyltransferase involved in cell wall biosynthesis